MEILRHEDRRYKESLQKSVSHKKSRSYQFVRNRAVRKSKRGLDGQNGSVVKWLRNHEISNPVPENDGDEGYYERNRTKNYPRKNIIDEVLETPSLSDSTISSSLVSVSSYGSRLDKSYTYTVPTCTTYGNGQGYTLHKRTESGIDLERNKIVI